MISVTDANALIAAEPSWIDGAGLTVALPSWVTQRCIRAMAAA
jgi:hypothetical protein